MRISFDLDDTLICYQADTPQEPRLPWPVRLFLRDEPLRMGTPDLIRQLRSRGWEVWIYTTSNRRRGAVRRWLRCHGIRINGVINLNTHNDHLRRSAQNRPASKNPSVFGIHLHVDDSEGVRIEGDAYGFRVVVVSPDDRDWTTKVLAAADLLQQKT